MEIIGFGKEVLLLKVGRKDVCWFCASDISYKNSFICIRRENGEGRNQNPIKKFRPNETL
jgi:hypothetical protein